jgi:hypothetical protein
VVPTGHAGRLSVAISIHPDDWIHPDTGPCRAVVNGDAQVLLDVTLDFRDSPDDRQWWWFDIPLAETADKLHTLTLSAVGIDGDACRRIVWRSPSFVWLEPAEAAETCTSFRPRFSAGCEFYVPGRTVA